MATHDVKYLKIVDGFNMCCVVVIISREWDPVLNTELNLHTMSVIYICILKSLNWSTYVQPQVQERHQKHNHIYTMLCFNPFFV